MANRAGPVRYHPEYACAIRAAAQTARSAAEQHFAFAVQANIPQHRADAITRGESALAIERTILSKIGAEPMPLRDYPELVNRA